MELAYADEEVDATAADANIAVLLAVPNGASVLRIRQIILLYQRQSRDLRSGSLSLRAPHSVHPSLPVKRIRAAVSMYRRTLRCFVNGLNGTVRACFARIVGTAVRSRSGFCGSNVTRTRETPAGEEGVYPTELGPGNVTISRPYLSCPLPTMP